MGWPSSHYGKPHRLRAAFHQLAALLSWPFPRPASAEAGRLYFQVLAILQQAAATAMCGQRYHNWSFFGNACLLHLPLSSSVCQKRISPEGVDICLHSELCSWQRAAKSACLVCLAASWLPVQVTQRLLCADVVHDRGPNEHVLQFSCDLLVCGGEAR